MTPAQLSRTVLHTLRCAIEEGELSLDPARLPGRVVVESPPRRGDGDYAVSVAFPLARAAGRPPREVAELLRKRLVDESGTPGAPGIGGVEIAGGGYLNVTLDAEGRTALVADLVRRDLPSAPSGPAGQVTDDPAVDIARWAAVTGDEPAALAVRTRDSSLFRVQYAHSRTHALLREARRLGIEPAYGAPQHPDPPHPTERTLLALLADHDRVAHDAPREAPALREASAPREAALALALVRHLDAVARAFGDFHDACPPLPHGEQKPGAVHRTRLALAEATGAVLADGLSQLGVTAPAHL
ncbi:DALR anticodon-binding domain-containing protein [Streptomyces sp. NPDC054796]